VIVGPLGRNRELGQAARPHAQAAREGKVMNMPKVPGDTATTDDEVRVGGVPQDMEPRPVTDDLPKVDPDGNTASSASATRQTGGIPDSLRDAGPK
jgi:hypothetical protein